MLLTSAVQEMLQWLHNNDCGNDDHSAILKYYERITGTTLIIRTNQILRDTLRTSMAEVIDRMGCENALYFHRAIIDAIAAHDEETASSLMARHIGKNREFFPEDGDK